MAPPSQSLWFLASLVSFELKYCCVCVRARIFISSFSVSRKMLCTNRIISWSIGLTVILPTDQPIGWSTELLWAQSHSTGGVNIFSRMRWILLEMNNRNIFKCNKIHNHFYHFVYELSTVHLNVYFIFFCAPFIWSKSVTFITCEVINNKCLREKRLLFMHMNVAQANFTLNKHWTFFFLRFFLVMNICETVTE